MRCVADAAGARADNYGDHDEYDDEDGDDDDDEEGGRRGQRGHSHGGKACHGRGGGDDEEDEEEDPDYKPPANAGEKPAECKQQ